MPRTADHEARHRQLTDAVRHLVSQDGFEAVTVAGVARQAGVSVGLVQHYFPSKDELLVSTYRATLSAVDARVQSDIASGEAARWPIRQIMTTALAQFLPLDQARHTDHAVRLALLVRSTTGPLARDLAAEHHAALRERVAVAVDNGTRCGEVSPDVPADLVAHELVGLVTGLGDQLYVAEEDLAPAAQATLAAAVRRTFAHPCRHHR